METEVLTRRPRPLPDPFCEALALTRQSCSCSLGSVRSGGESCWSRGTLGQGQLFGGELPLLGGSCDLQPFLQMLILLCAVLGGTLSLEQRARPAPVWKTRQPKKKPQQPRS